MLFILVVLAAILNSCYCFDSHFAKYGTKDDIQCFQKRLKSPECAHIESIFAEYFGVQYELSSARTVASVVDVKPKTPYLTMFQEFLLKKSPYKSKLDSDDLSHKSTYNMSISWEQLLLHLGTSLSPFLEERLLSGSIPRIFTNNYLLRLSNSTRVSAIETNHCSSGLPRIHDWSDSSFELFRCSASMNTVLWIPASAKSSINVSVNVRLFQINTIVSTVNNSEQVGSHHSGCFGLQRFCKKGFPTSGEINHSPNCQPLLSPSSTSSVDGRDFIETSLNEGEYLFVPHGFAASIQPIISETDSKTDTFLLSSCSVDASNLVEFENSLRTSFSPFDRTLLSELRSSAVDLSIERFPVELSVRKYLEILMGLRSFPAEDRGESKSQPQPSQQRDRRKRGKNDFKDWQDAINWNARVTALTMPRLSPPLLLTVGRSAATFELANSFAPSASDRTAFGLLIELCQLDLAREGALLAAVERSLLDSSANNETLNNCTLRRTLWSDKEVLRVKDEQQSLFSLHLSGLEPGRLYQLSLRLFYDRAEGPASLWSRPFLTEPISFPSQPLPPQPAMFPLSEVDGAVAFGPSAAWFSGLRASLSSFGPYLACEVDFTLPIDDGGEPILGYHVFARQSTKAGDAVISQPEWAWRGAFKAASQGPGTHRISMRNFKPNVIYEFKLAAFNALGNSTLSVVSNAVAFPSSRKAPHSPISVFGRDHPMYYAGLSGLTESFIQLPADQGMLMQILDDGGTHTTIRLLSQPKTSFDLWGCSWGFSASETAAGAVILPASADDVFERITFIKRGQEPIAMKALSAQRMGAVAVIVVDDGRCSDYSQSCLPGADKRHEERFAMEDSRIYWEGVTVPTYFILRDHAEVLWSEMLRLAQRDEL